MRLKVALHPALLYLGKLVLLAAIYCGAGLFGLQYASIGQSVSLIWPPSGIAFAALVLLGYPGTGPAWCSAPFSSTSPPLFQSWRLSGLHGEYARAPGRSGSTPPPTGPRPQLGDLRTVRSFVLAAAPLGSPCAAVRDHHLF